MTKLSRVIRFVALVLVVSCVSVLAQGPLTSLMTIRTRTDANGSLMTTFSPYLGPSTPLTTFSSLRGRTDSNGSIIVTTLTGVGGSAAIVAVGRSTAQTAAVASVATYTVGSSDGSFEVSGNVLVTTATTHSFGVNVTYTDEGNTSRTDNLVFNRPGSGTNLDALIINANGAVAYAGISHHIRAKAGTVITVFTTGTFTTVTYNVEGIIKQQA